MSFQEPYYQLYISNSSCVFDIRVNDMQAIHFNYPGTVAFDQPINHLMLQSGKQKLKVRLYPPQETHLLNERSKIEIKIQVMEAKSDFSVRKEVAALISPALNGQAYWEQELEFDATLPYKLNGWQNSASLKSIPDLKQKLFSWYSKMHGIVERKEFSSFETLNRKAYEEDAVSIYDPSFMSGHLPEVYGYINEPGFKLVPLDFDALQVHHYADGKVAALHWPDHKPAIFLQYPEEKSFYTIDLFLHQPVPGGDFEVIR